MSEREQNNRKIAEWLDGPQPSVSPKIDTENGERSNPAFDVAVRDSKGWRYVYYTGWQSLDFYLDEAANAMVLEKMRRPLLVSDWPGCEGWRVDIGYIVYGGVPIGPTHTDRKTAICEAALKLIEGGAK